MSVGKASREKKVPINEALGNQGGHEKELNSSLKSPAKGSLQETTSIVTFIPILILLLVSFTVYFNTLYNGFVYDDMTQILGNRWIRDVRHLPDIFTENVWGFEARTAVSNYYRPLMYVIYMISFFVFGLNPWGFHLVNILFHIGNTLLVFMVASRLLGGAAAPPSSPLVKKEGLKGLLSLPFVAALLFATHPIHTEAVAWVGAITDLSYTFFYLLSLYFYMRSGTDSKKYDYPVSIVAFSFALLCKEPAVTLPFILIAYDFAFGKPSERLAIYAKRYLPFFAVSGIYLIVRSNVLGSFSPVKAHGELTMYQYIINIFPLFVLYLERLLLPINLNAFYPLHSITSLWEMKGILCLIIAIAYVALTVLAYKKNKKAFFCLALIAMPLLPALYIPALGEASFAERYLYLPSAGFLVLLAMPFVYLRGKITRYGLAAVVAATVLAVTYSVQTIIRNPVWKDNLTLFTDTVKKSPDGELPLGMLGIALMEAGRYDEAIVEFRNTLKLNPDSANAHYNLGLTFYKKGTPQEAIPKFQKALALTPSDVDAHRYLGLCYAMVGRIDEAIEQYGILSMSNSNSLATYFNLGVDLEKKGLVNEAIAIYKKALAMAPENADVQYALLNAYIKSGQVGRAIDRYKEEVRLKPANALYHNLLGAAYTKQQAYDKAIEQFQMAVKLDPSKPVYRKNLDLTLEMKNSAGTP
jgi:protein O-mannosyl-transferase